MDKDIKQRLIWEESKILFEPDKRCVGKCNPVKSDKYKTWIFKGIGSKNLLKQFLTFEREYKCIAQIQDNNGYRQFLPFTSWEQCWEAYRKIHYKHRYLNEVIVSDNYCKPYIDIEWKTEDDTDNIDFSPFIDKLLNDIINVFANRYKLTINNSHILISKAHAKKKVSFHVVINCVINGVYYACKTNRKREDCSAWDLYVVLTTLDPEYKNKMDESVYSLDREFRAIYSTKYGEMRHLVPYKDIYTKFCPNYLDYFVTYFDKDKQIQLINMPEYVCPNRDVLRKANKITDIKGVYFKYPKNDSDIDKQVLDRVYELVQVIHPTAFFTNMTQKRDGFRFSYNDKNEPCYTGRLHQHNGFAIFIRNDTGNVYMYCFSVHCQRLFRLGNLKQDDTWKQEAVRINQRYLEYKYKIKSMNIIEKEDVRFSGLIHKFVENGGNYVIKSRMGTGKSFLLRELIKIHFMDKRILYLSHRQTFTLNVYGSLKEIGFYNYLDGVENIGTQDKIILQIDSLRHLISDEMIIKRFDIIILDELESLLNHLSSPTLIDKRNLVCMILNQLLKNAKWVVSLDADFGIRGYEFLSKIKEKPHIIINDYTTVQKKFIFHCDYNKQCFNIVEDLKNHKNVVVIALSKATVDDLYQRVIGSKIRGVKTIRYTSMTDDAQKIDLNNVNETWKNKNCVMYSPTIEAGVSFDIEHFHKMYCFLSGGSCSPRSFLQMIGRIRILEEHEIQCCHEKSMIYAGKNIYIPPIKDVEEQIIAHGQNTINQQFVDVGNDGFKLELKKDAFTRTFAHNYIENYEKTVRFLPILKEMIRENNWKYSIDNGNDKIKKEITDDEKEDDDNETDNDDSVSESSNIPEICPEEGMEITIGNTTKLTTEIDEILDCPMVSADEYTRLLEKKNKNKATRLDKLSIEKYRLIKKFRIKEIDFTADFAHDWKGKEYILDNILYYIGKLKVDSDDDQYLNTMKQRKIYVDQLVQVYGFKNLYDFDTTVTKDDEMEDRMRKSQFLQWDTYVKIMMTFNKRMHRTKEDNKFSVSAFIMLSDALFGDYGVELISSKYLKRSNGERNWIYDYNLAFARIGIDHLIKTQKK